MEMRRLVATSEWARELFPPRPQAEQVEFHVWHSSKKVGTTRPIADGYIIVKLDAEVRVISEFILYPVWCCPFAGPPSGRWAQSSIRPPPRLASA
jgi:hypothetical protein